MKNFQMMTLPKDINQGENNVLQVTWMSDTTVSQYPQLWPSGHNTKYDVWLIIHIAQITQI
jgi:hypothetical protein